MGPSRGRGPDFIANAGCCRPRTSTAALVNEKTRPQRGRVVCTNNTHPCKFRNHLGVFPRKLADARSVPSHGVTVPGRGGLERALGGEFVVEPRRLGRRGVSQLQADVGVQRLG